MDNIEVNPSVVWAFSFEIVVMRRSLSFYCCVSLFFSDFMDTTAYYVDLIWFSSPWHWGYSVRWWLSYLYSRDCRQSQVTRCYCSIFQDVFAFFSCSTFLFPSWVTKPCFPFWKLYFYSQFYVRLKAGALEGYQLINKLQASHLVIKLFHWSKWKFRPLAFKWQFQVWRMCSWKV